MRTVKSLLLPLLVAGLSFFSSTLGQVTTGPIVLFDLGHHNLIAENATRVESVASFLTENGYTVRRSSARLDAAALGGVAVLLVVNARAERNVKDWALPTPSAFEAQEIEATRRWVQAGGGLFLAVDHMPFPGAADELATALGIEFANGFVFDESKLKSDNSFEPFAGVVTFSRRERTLGDHPVTNGRTAAERIDSLSIDTGSMFFVKAKATPLLTIPGGFVVLKPQKAWQFAADTPRAAAGGALQGAALNIGEGRVTVFADAGTVMTPELARGMPKSDESLNNAQLFLSAVRWLSDGK